MCSLILPISESGHSTPKFQLKLTRDHKNNGIIGTGDVCRVYLSDPPSRLVLWWISFQVTTPSFPVVLDTPMVNTSLCLKACSSKWRTSWPSLLSGRYACRSIPVNDSPGFG